MRLTADQGPQARYTAWLKVLRGHVRCVVGTRAAAFAPVHDLGLLAGWDDGDDLLDELRAPYPHVRDVLLERSGAPGRPCSSAASRAASPPQQRVEDGVLAPVAATARPRAARRRAGRRSPATTTRSSATAPPRGRTCRPVAWRTAKQALERGPVLVQVPRRGYLPSLTCAECREPARCPRCHGPMGLDGGGGVPDLPLVRRDLRTGGFVCPHCEPPRCARRSSAPRRTAEELGRAFPGVPVRTSGSGEVLARVGPDPALVIATPGAEPVADGRYAASLLLDAWALLDRSSLDAAVEALRRWPGAAALTRRVRRGGRRPGRGAVPHDPARRRGAGAVGPGLAGHP